MSAVPAGFLVARTRTRLLESFDMWANDADATVLADFEGKLNTFQFVVEVAARTRARAELVAEMHDRLSKEAAP